MEDVSILKEQAAEYDGTEQQFVTFMIGDEVYGVSVLEVQEIIGMTDITHVPKTLKFMKGVINLRGAVVPVLDMRIKFKMETREYDESTVIIIVEVRGRLIGMIVDSVSDVATIPESGIQDAYHFSTRIDTDYIDKVGQMEDKLLIILNVEKILEDDSDGSEERDTAGGAERESSGKKEQVSTEGSVISEDEGSENTEEEMEEKDDSQ